MNLFTPKRADGKAEWRVVYELFNSAPYGTLVTLDTLCASLAVPRDGPLHRVYAAVNRAGKELRRSDQRSVECVRNLGYRVLKPEEYQLQERRYRRKSQRQLTTALAVNHATPLDLLSAEMRRETIDRRGVTQAFLGVMRDFDRRISESNRLIEAVAVDTSERLERHEREIESLKRMIEGAKPKI